MIFFLFIHENICCGYSLEAPGRGASHEYPQHMFSWRNIIYVWKLETARRAYDQQSLTARHYFSTDRAIRHPLISTPRIGTDPVTLIIQIERSEHERAFRICVPLNLTLTVCKYSRYRYAKYEPLTNLTNHQ